MLEYRCSDKYIPRGERLVTVSQINKNRDILLLKYGEVVMKGLNRSYFDSLILKRIKNVLREVDGKFSYTYSQSTLCIRGSDDADMQAAAERLKTVFGIAAVCIGKECEKTVEAITETVRTYAPYFLASAKTFKCEAKRADKAFPLTSPQICMEMGGVVLEVMPHLTVDVHNPDETLVIEIRDTFAFVRGHAEKAVGGMPVGSAGSSVLLLSGGIDSPVAGYMMAKRGLALDAVYFETPPYTSENAKEKVISLAERLAFYCGKIYLNCISITEIQDVLREKCEERLFTVLLRRFMIRLACKLAAETGAGALITGESVGQVASQTLDAITATNAVSEIPIFRPCIGLDKDEIVQISRKIGTFETSILPYDDCCVLFTPKHPNIHPKIEDLLEEEAKVDVEALVESAYATRRVIKIQ